MRKICNYKNQSFIFFCWASLNFLEQFQFFSRTWKNHSKWLLFIVHSTVNNFYIHFAANALKNQEAFGVDVYSSFLLEQKKIMKCVFGQRERKRVICRRKIRIVKENEINHSPKIRPCDFFSKHDKYQKEFQIYLKRSSLWVKLMQKTKKDLFLSKAFVWKIKTLLLDLIEPERIV